MLEDISYSVIKQDGDAYQIMLLRDQCDCTYTDIAKKYGISVTRVIHIYNKLKIKQKCLYINHIAFTIGQKSTEQIRKVFQDAYECYQGLTYACAYLEKKYKNILREYRNGEPGMPEQFIRDLPPLKIGLSETMIARVVEMREVEKASYTLIAKEMRMTREKAKHTYEMYYHKQVLEIIHVLQDKAESYEEKAAIWKSCFKGNISSKDRYETLAKIFDQ